MLKKITDKKYKVLYKNVLTLQAKGDIVKAYALMTPARFSRHNSKGEHMAGKKALVYSRCSFGDMRGDKSGDR